MVKSSGKVKKNGKVNGKVKKTGQKMKESH